MVVLYTLMSPYAALCLYFPPLLLVSVSAAAAGEGAKNKKHLASVEKVIGATFAPLLSGGVL